MTNDVCDQGNLVGHNTIIITDYDKLLYKLSTCTEFCVTRDQVRKHLSLISLMQWNQFRNALDDLCKAQGKLVS